MRLQGQSTEISRGAAVHHPHHGIGQVQQVGKRRFAGSNGPDYAQLYFKRDDLTLIMPVDDVANTVRRPLDASQAGQLLDYIEHWNGKCSKQWKARAAAHQQAMERNDPFAYAEVCKGLSRLESEGNLRHTDRTHLNRSIEFLADELAYALDKTPDYARMLIVKATGNGQ
jgi:RNA polymerase-interacting CarD/CdnL/TRCF family regulator